MLNSYRIYATIIYIMPSRKKPITKKNRNFVKRFVEVCGSKKPRKIEKLLGISYQTALNYLNGRLPEAHILIKISEKTGRSIHWLLTGNGTKYVDETFQDDSQRLSTNIHNNFPPRLVKKLNLVFEDYEPERTHKNTVSPKVVKLRSEHIRFEKEKDEESKNLPVKED